MNFMYKQALINHVNNPNTVSVPHSYRGENIIEYYNPSTNLGVKVDLNGNFKSGWYLNTEQRKLLLDLINNKR